MKRIPHMRKFLVNLTDSFDCIAWRSDWLSTSCKIHIFNSIIKKLESNVHINFRNFRKLTDTTASCCYISSFYTWKWKRSSIRMRKVNDAFQYSSQSEYAPLYCAPNMRLDMLPGGHVIDVSSKPLFPVTTVSSCP